MAMIHSLPVPHWLMIAGAALVVPGFVGLAGDGCVAAYPIQLGKLRAPAVTNASAPSPAIRGERRRSRS